MNRKPVKGWLKHGDFIILDLLCMQLCFTIAYWIINGVSSPYATYRYRYLAEVLFASQIMVTAFSSVYKDILRKGRLDGAFNTAKYSAYVFTAAILWLFLVHRIDFISRLHLGTTICLFVPLDYIVTSLNRKRILKSRHDGFKRIGKSLVIITSGALVDEAVGKLTDPMAHKDYFISGIILLDNDKDSIQGEYDVPILPLNSSTMERLRVKWVDEVFILQPSDAMISRRLLNEITDMGITVNFTLAILNDDDWPQLMMRKLGRYRVLTSSIRIISMRDMVLKRAMDIVGGILGCIVTGILFIFVAPAIYIKSPGPIFFTQERIGLNGKVFRMYKFRSMYMDAEERKAALMEQNKVGNDLMFKMDDDPRIIGSEKKDKNGKPKGIGNFIRNTSIDEFPQFWNVLKGDMSLVGTRPPLKSEWDLYDLHHRARMTVKPGITGLWQVSGRSEITDFEEVVRLDRDYIETWSITQDIRILLKTIVVVVKGRGAE